MKYSYKMKSSPFLFHLYLTDNGYGKVSILPYNVLSMLPYNVCNTLILSRSYAMTKLCLHWMCNKYNYPHVALDNNFFVHWLETMYENVHNSEGIVAPCEQNW